MGIGDCRLLSCRHCIRAPRKFPPDGPSVFNTWLLRSLWTSVSSQWEENEEEEMHAWTGSVTHVTSSYMSLARMQLTIWKQGEKPGKYSLWEKPLPSNKCVLWKGGHIFGVVTIIYPCSPEITVTIPKTPGLMYWSVTEESALPASSLRLWALGHWSAIKWTVLPNKWPLLREKPEGNVIEY